jgi:diacylglycerol kinase family enzyme
VPIQIIANPIAGGGRGKQAGEELLRALQARALEAELFLTKAKGDGSRFATRLNPQNRSAVLVVGGDGSLNEVLNGLPDPTLPLGLLPMGTANVLACELALPSRPEDLADLVQQGRLIDLDIGLANERRFLLFLGAGMDASIVHRLEQVRKGRLGKLRWTGPILHTALHWPRPRIRVELDGGEVIEGCSQVLITKSRSYGGVMRMPAGISMKPGPFHVLCLHQRGRLAYGLVGLRGMLGRLRPGRDLGYYRAERVELSSTAEVPCQIDGDGAGTTPQSLRIAEEKVKLFAPAMIGASP